MDRRIEQDNRSLLTLTDRLSGLTFLVDTGATTSIIPATEEEKKQKAIDYGTGVGEGAVQAYGKKEITLDLGLGRRYTWQFWMTSHSQAAHQAILGADFIAHYHLVVDVYNHTVHDDEVMRHRYNLAPAPSEEAPKPEDYGLDRSLSYDIENGGTSIPARVDTGLVRSIVPPAPGEILPKDREPLFSLLGVGGKINIMRERPYNLIVDQQRSTMSWVFGVCDPLPCGALIGTDFLNHHKLKVDLHNKTLYSPVPPQFVTAEPYSQNTNSPPFSRVTDR